MLSNVLEDYFSSIKDERDFDFPLMSLLAAVGLAGLILLSVLLRDRYFPKVWRQLVD